MNKYLVKVSLAMIVIGLAAGCDSQPDAPTTSAALTQTPETETVTPVESDSKALSPTEYDTPASSTKGGYCALDTVNGAPAAGASFESGTDVVFGGWMADATKQVPAEAKLIFGGSSKSYFVPLTAGGERRDVAKSLDSEALVFSGYNILLSLDMAPGTYNLAILQGSPGEPAYCVLKRTITITN